MPKRKLKSTRSSTPPSDEKRTKQKQSVANPFLQTDKNDQDTARLSAAISDGTFEEDLLAHTIVFLDADRHPRENEQKNVFESLEFLVIFLEENLRAEKEDEDGRTNAIHSDASVTRTSTILLPWIVKKLLDTSTTTIQNGSLLWRALAVTLEDFALPSDANQNVHFQMKQGVRNTLLTMKIVLKLVSHAAQVALEGGVSSTHATKCYQALLQQGQFMPTVDVACKTLFLGIVDKLPPQKDSCASLVIVATIQMLKETLKKANSKTAFQVVSAEETLAAFSKVYFYFRDLSTNYDASQESQDLILEILWESLFHPEHHLDGFRSILQMRGVPALNSHSSSKEPMEWGEKQNNAAKQSSFHCYQENLLSSLRNMLIFSENQLTKTRKESMTLVIRLLPLLVQGCLEKLSVFDKEIKKNQTKKRGGSSKFDLAQMQLFFFATAAVPLWHLASHYNGEDVQRYSLESLSTCLQLLLKHDAFVPSDEEKQVSRFELLEALTVGTIETSWPNLAVSKHSTVMATALASLDHRLVDDRLEKMLRFCAAQRKLEKDTRSPESQNLMLVLIKSYQQLRRFRRIFTALLETVSVLQSQKEKEKLMALSSLLLQSSVQRSIADAVQGSPSMEVKSSFEELNKWILVALASIEKSSTLALSVAIRRVAVGFLANIRVDKSTAPEVAELCQLLMQNSVKALCDIKNDSAEERTKLGVTLCAWIINLQMRCAFWLGYEYIHKSETDATIPLPIRQMLSASKKDSEGAAGVPDDLMLLATFRLRQLDYLVHEQNFAETDELSLREEYNEEARNLAKQMVVWASNSNESSGWHHIAQVITSWVPYVDEEDLRSFLLWLYSALADANGKHDEAICVYPNGRTVSRSVYEKERSVAMALSKDASFLEIQELSNLSVPCILSTIALLLQETDKKTSSTYSRELANILGTDWSPSSSKQYAAQFKWDNPIQLSKKTSPEKLSSLLAGALRLVKVLNGLPIVYLPANCADSTARLESFCRRIHCDNQMVSILLRDLNVSLRLAAAKTLSLASEEVYVLMPTDNNLERALEHIKDSLEQMLELMGEAETEQGQKLIFATGEFVASFVGRALRTSDTSSSHTMLNHLTSLFIKSPMSDRNKKQSSNEVVARCVNGRAVLEALSSSFNQTAFNTTNLAETVLALLSSFESFYGNCMGSPFLRYQGCLLIGALFRFLVAALTEITAPMAVRVRILSGKVLDSVLSAGDRDLGGALYMVSCFAATNPSDDERLSTIEKLLKLDHQSAWLDASIGSLIRNMNGEPLSNAVMLVNKKVQEGPQPNLRLLQALLRAVQSEEQIKIVSHFVPAMLQIALIAFDGSASTDESGNKSTISIASSLITELTQDRRLVTLRERDIALILAQTSSVMATASQDNNAIASSCFSVVASLVQRFPKQLYTCVPSLIAVMHTFLRHVMYDELNEVTMRDRSQKLTRLVELLLPHKDVYKKHVLCLLLEFVHCLERDLSLFRKECLLPAIFYLLDMLSKYEMQQLNILMDTTAKTLFRSVHQSYQKLHAYKGQ